MKYGKALVGCAAGIILIGSPMARAQFHGHGQSAYPKLNYDSLFEAATPVVDAPEALQLIQDCLEAYGGPEHLNGLRAFKAEWLMDSPLYEESVPIVRSYGPDRKHRIEIQRTGRKEIRVLRGQIAWLSSHDTVLVIDQMRYKAELFTHLSLGLPLSIEAEPFAERRWGRRTDDSLHYLYLSKTDSLLLVVGINPGDHLISLVEGIIKQGDQRMVFVNRLGDYREVGGFLFPHELVNISMGMMVGSSQLKAVEINPDFVDDEFEKPLQINMSRMH